MGAGVCFLDRICFLIVFLCAGWAGFAQDSPPAAQQGQMETAAENRHPNLIRNVLDLLNMAEAQDAKNFRALTQSERNHLYLRSMVNPLSFVRVASSAGIDQAKDKPEEWEQGASGYGKRFANIFGQYSIQRTVSYGLGSLLHEDNRYFNSGQKSFWPRVGYALESGILARRDDGTRRFSISQAGGVAAGAFLARPWLPPSQSSLADAATSFGITTGTNIGFGVFKEFLPDMVRPFLRKRKQSTSVPNSGGV
jgi:hypothetical protein